VPETSHRIRDTASAVPVTIPVKPARYIHDSNPLPAKKRSGSIHTSRNHPTMSSSEQIKYLPSRFQLIIDTDSVFISTAPGGKRQRVLITNISDDQVALIKEQLRDSGILDADYAFTIARDPEHLGNETVAQP